MIVFSRRDVVLTGAAALAVSGIAKRFTFISSAIAAEAGFHRFKVGGVEVTTVFDGKWDKPHDPGFITNASVEDTKAALRAAGLSDGAVPIPFTVTFVKIGDTTVMFDAGTGGQLAPTAGRLAENMAAAGIDAKSINKVIVTHFHPDHIFGLMEKDTNAQVYPGAEIVVPEAELAWWASPDVFSKLPPERHGLAKRIQATLPSWKNVRTVDWGKEAAPGIVAVAAPGHTAGHTVYQIASSGKELLVLADTSNMPALFARHPEWHAAFDADADLAEKTRRALFERAIAEKAVVTGYHYGMPGAGTIEKDGAGYAFVPVA
jgi:glyoxylase-like metal-dependent hydrolase (beta-lactamase superfamily II)